MNKEISRRSFLKGIGGAAALSGLALGYSALYADTEKIELKETTLRYSSLPKDLIGFRIGFLTDLHLGGWVRTELIERSIAVIKESKVDLLLLGGDYLWVPDTFGDGTFDTFINKSFNGASDEEIAEKIYTTLGSLIKSFSCPHGIAGVLGNHDRWSSYDSYHRHLKPAGVSVLLNAVHEIKRGNSTLQIVGTEDLWTGVPHLPNLPSINSSEFRLLLTHNPDFASWAYHSKAYPFHLALCGHTHGGQVKIPLIGALNYNIRDARYGEGLVDYGDTKFYTSRGIGVVEVPLRVNCPPEATVLTLERT